MPSGTLSRSSAARASLAAKVALATLAPLAIAGAILGLKDIPNPNILPPDFTDPADNNNSPNLRPVNYSTMSRVLTLAGEFPPLEILPVPSANPGDGTGDGPPPSGPALPVVRFLGAIAEPGRYVALLNIDGRQKFLGPGDSFGTIHVLDCSATEVQIQIDNSDGTRGPTQAIAVSKRAGSPVTTGTGPSAAPAPGTEEKPGDPAAQSVPNLPGLPPGFVPPPGTTPAQFEEIRRRAQAASRAGDGSQ